MLIIKSELQNINSKFWEIKSELKTINSQILRFLFLIIVINYVNWNYRKLINHDSFWVQVNPGFCGSSFAKLYLTILIKYDMF